MGVHQFLSWLRARHPQAFRTSRKLRSVEDDSFKSAAAAAEQQRQNEDDDNSSSSDSDTDSSSSHDDATAADKQHQQPTSSSPIAVPNKKKKKTLSGSEDDYAVICLDINALLHEVATAVTTENSSVSSSSSGGTSSFSGLPNKNVVEREILIRLRKQIEDLIYVAGGEALKFLQAEHHQQNSSSSNKKKNSSKNNNADESSNNIGILTFDNLVEDIDSSSAADAKASAKSTLYNGHQFKMFDANNNNNNKDENNNNTHQQQHQEPPTKTEYPSVAEQGLLPVDILLVIDGVAPVGKCPQQRERRATKKTSGTIQEKTQQLLIQAAEQRSGRALLAQQQARNNQRFVGGRNYGPSSSTSATTTADKTIIGEDGEFISLTTSINGGDFTSTRNNTNNINLSSTASSIWDGNAITVGTPFMQQVCSMLHYTAGALVKMYRNLRVFVSDASVPGEGEQKIFSALRSGIMWTTPLSQQLKMDQAFNKKNTTTTTTTAITPQMRKTIQDDETRRICVCSNDTDSIVMALLLCDEDLVSRPIDVWRTPSVQLKNLATQTLQQGAALTAGSPSGSSSSQSATLQQYLIQQQNATAWIFDMSIFVRDLKKAFSWREAATASNTSNNDDGANFDDAMLMLNKKNKTANNNKDAATASNNNDDNTATSSTLEPLVIPSSAKKRTFGGAMKSFAFMLSLFGGDFLPRVSDLSIAEGDLDDVIQVLSDELFIKEQWIVDPIQGTVDLQSMHFVLQCLNERKYALDVVETNQGGASRRGRTGEEGNNAQRNRGAGGQLSLVMGNNSNTDGGTFNPFASSTTSTNNNNDAPPRHIKAFWEGIVWVGRYFDGVIINWGWFFEVGADTFTSAINNHHSAPRLRDLVQYSSAFVGKPVEMASYAAKLFNDQVDALQRGLGGQLFITKNKHMLNKNNIKSNNSNNNNNNNSSNSPKTITDLLLFQQQTDLFSEVIPIAFAAVVLPYYSWANILPRMLGDQLLEAYDLARSQTLEEEKLEQDKEDANDFFKQEQAKLLDWKSNYAHIDSIEEKDPKDGFMIGGTTRQKNMKLAKLFIRQQRNLKGFNPVKAVSAVMKLVINLQNKFSKDEARLLTKKEMYKLSWTKLTTTATTTSSSSTTLSPSSLKQDQQALLTSDQIEDQNNNKIGFFKNQHILFEKKLALTALSSSKNSEAVRLWNDHFGPNAKNKTSVSDVLSLWSDDHNDGDNNQKDASSSFSGIFMKSDETMLDFIENLLQNQNEQKEGSSSSSSKQDAQEVPPNLQNILEVVNQAENIARIEAENFRKEKQERAEAKHHQRELEKQKRKEDENENNNNQLDENNEDAAVRSPQMSPRNSSSSNNNSNKTSLDLLSVQNISKIGAISIPAAIKFAGLSTSSSAASVLSAALLKSFPTLMNQPTSLFLRPASSSSNNSNTNEAIMVQEAIGVV